MAGSKHPKLLPKAKKDVDRMKSEVTALQNNTKKWIKQVDTAARAVAKSAQAYKVQVDAQKKMLDTYKTKVDEIKKAEQEQKGSKDEEKEKALKKLDGEADRLREAYNIGAKKLDLIIRNVAADSKIDSSGLMGSFG